MKRVMPIALGTVTACVALSTSVWAADLLPGQVDFGSFSPPKGGGQFVEVNVPASLIAAAAQLVQKQEPDVAKLLDGLKRVHVNVIGLDKDNRADLQKRARKLADELTGKGWEHIVAVQQKNQDVGIYVKMGDQNAIQGLVVVVLDGDEQAVFVNVVGDIKPEQLGLLGEKFHIDPLKKFGPKAEPKARAEDDQK